MAACTQKKTMARMTRTSIALHNTSMEDVAGYVVDDNDREGLTDIGKKNEYARQN